MWTKIIIVVDEQMHSLFIKTMKKKPQRKPKKNKLIQNLIWIDNLASITYKEKKRPNRENSIF